MSPRRTTAEIEPAKPPAAPRKARTTRLQDQSVTKGAHDAILASAAAFGVGADNDTTGLPPPTIARLWQEEAWTYFELVPEFQYAAGFYGSCFSRVSLAPAFENEEGEVSTTFDDEAPVSDPSNPVAAAEISQFINTLRPTTGGQPALMRAFGINFGVAGEAYLVREVGLDVEYGPWDVLSVNELRPNTGPENSRRKFGRPADVTWMRWHGPGYLPTKLGPESFIVRLWQPHPRYGIQPHAAVKACLPHLENLVLLDREMRGTTVSRLASNGLLLLSDEIDYPDDEDAPDGSEGKDSLTRDLIANAGVAISDKSSAVGAIPLIARAPTEAIERGVKLISFAKADDPVAIAKRRELVERFAQGYDLPRETTLGHAETTFCADTETEILTRSGWKTWEDVQVGEDVYTLNHRTGMAEWQPCEFIHAFPVEDEPVLSLESQSHSSLTSANHRWPTLKAGPQDRSMWTRAWGTSETINPNHRIITAAQSADLATDPKYQDDFVELVAWHWTEGHVHRQSGQTAGVTTISQSLSANPTNCDRIRAMLYRLFGSPSPNLRGRGAHKATNAWTERRDLNRPMARFVLSRDITAELEAVAPDKRVTREFILSLTRAQLELFIDVSQMADGWRTNMGSRVIGQSVPDMLEGLELATILTGRTPRRWMAHHLHGGTGETHYLALSDRQVACVPPGQSPANQAQRHWTRYTGVLWCPTTRNATWMARRRGKVFFTGNSNAFQISIDLYQVHIEPKLVNVVDGLTAGALHPWLRLRHGIGPDQPLPPELARRRIHYNASRLVSHPDRSKEATEGRKMFLVSDTAWRRANGFTEDDAMSPDELATAINIVRQTNVKETIRAEDTNVTPILDPNLARPEVQPGAPDRHDQDPLTASITPIGVLAMRLASAADATVERAVERAQAQLVNLAKRSPDATTQIDGVAKSLIAASLGRARVDAMTAGRHALFVGEFDAFRRRAGAYAREHGCSDPDALACAATDEVERLARKRLYDPDVAVGLESFAHLVARAGFVNASAVPAGPSRELSGAG